MTDHILYSRPLTELVEMLREVIREEIRTSTPSAPGHNDQPMSIDDAAAFTGFSKPTIYSFLRDRKIPAHKKCGRWLFFRSELVGWIKGDNEAQVIEIVNRKHTQIKKAK